MDIDAMLCDHAEAVGGKLFLNGGGIAYAWVQPNPPHVIRLSLGIVIQIPYTATNQPHTLAARLVDHDGNPAKVWVPEGAEAAPPAQAVFPFNVGRPPHIVPGDPQPFPFGVNFQVPLAEQGAYSFVIEVDGTEARRLPFRATVPPPGVFPMVQPIVTPPHTP